MKLEFRDVNIHHFQGTDQPGFIIQRENPRSRQETGFTAGETKPDGRWYMLKSPVALKDQQAQGWTWDGTSNNVFVPLVPYLTPDRDSRRLVGFAAQIGALAMQGHPWEHRLPELLLIGLSDVFETPEGGFQFWLGFAVRTPDI